MASIEYITKRIAGKEKEITKLQKKMERIIKAQATNWEVNPYYYSEYDLKYTTRDLAEAKEMLEKYKADLKTEQEKADSRNVKAIIDFLEMWKARMRKFYSESFKRYLKAREEYYKVDKEYWDWINSNWKSPERKQRQEAHREYVKEFRSAWVYIELYVDGNSFNTARFEKDIKAEAERKYDSIIERTNEITGTITDATGLEVGEKGELDGYVIGERGKAHVHTIGAGGYNIQCYHFRVLVHEVR